MEFFGITHYGQQNYIRDSMKPEYMEPMNKEDVKPLIEKVKKLSTLPANIQQVDVDIIRVIDCYLGRVDGFAFGSSQRFNKMKRKGVIKPIGPCDMYRFPPTTSVEYGWWQHDLALLNKTWYKLEHRSPQPSSPNTLILDKSIMRFNGAQCRIMLKERELVFKCTTAPAGCTKFSVEKK